MRKILPLKIFIFHPSFLWISQNEKLYKRNCNEKVDQKIHFTPVHSHIAKFNCNLPITRSAQRVWQEPAIKFAIIDDLTFLLWLLLFRFVFTFISAYPSFHTDYISKSKYCLFGTTIWSFSNQQIYLFLQPNLRGFN